MKNVTVYMGPRCNFCDAAKRLLLRNIIFIVRLIDNTVNFIFPRQLFST